MTTTKAGERTWLGVRPTTWLAAVGGVAMLAATLPPVVMFSYFGGHASTSPADWAATADFVGGVSASLLSALGVVATILLALAVRDWEEASSARAHEAEQLAVRAQFRPVLRLYARVSRISSTAIDCRLELVNDGIGPAGDLRLFVNGRPAEEHIAAMHRLGQSEGAAVNVGRVEVVQGLGHIGVGETVVVGTLVIVDHEPQNELRRLLDAPTVWDVTCTDVMGETVESRIVPKFVRTF